jgi:hypothetical protein
LYEELTTKTPAEDEAMTIYIARDKKEDIWHVSGFKINREEPFGLSFGSWDEWVSFNVIPQQVKDLGVAHYLAHCIYEITYYGWTEADREKKAKMIFGE